jgi:hypothetical protein
VPTHLTIQMGTPGITASPSAGLAAGTGTANTGGPSLAPHAGNAAGTGSVPIAFYPNVPAYTTTTINVDGTNTTDEYANINAAIAAVGSGSSSSYHRFLLNPSGGTTVKMSGALQIANKSYWILDLGGATLKTVSGAAFTQLTGGIVVGHGYGGFWDGNADHFVITNGTLWQNNPSPGVYSVTRESQANIEIAGGGTSTPCHHGSIYNMVLRGAGGDNIKLGGDGDITYNVDGFLNNCIDAGRVGYTVIYGHDHTWGTFGRNTHGACGYNCWDIEPNVASNPSSAIYIDNNTWTTWSNAFGGVNGSSKNCAFDDIRIRNNSITGGSLLTVLNNAASRPTNIVYTGNVSTGSSVAGPVLLFAHIDGLVYQSTPNTQPLSSGAIASVSDCTSVS